MGCGGSATKPVLVQEEQALKDVAAVEPRCTAQVPANVPNSEGPVDFKPIHSAIRWNKSPDDVKRMLKGKEALNCIDSGNGNAPIHIAAQNGHLDIVQHLISGGALLNVQNAKGNTAIHMAIGYDYYECAQALVDAGADPSIKNSIDIPGSEGLEGGKSFAAAAWNSASTISSAETALKLCEDNPSTLDKASFVSGGLRLKKSLGADWTPAHHNRFKAIMAAI
jgi:ankyrin repeat protein